MSRASVSVLIPAFNGRRWVRQAVDSVLAQSVPAAEIIVVDDGSTDGTSAVLAEYGSRIRCITQPNQGVAAARNAGLRAATGDLIAFLDADDAWHPLKLELQVRAMAEHPGVGTLGTRVYDWPIGTLPTVEREGELRVTDIDRDRLAVKNRLAVSAVLVRRDIVRRVGEFDVQLHGAADHDYWLRAAEVSGVANLELPLMGYRSVAGSMSKQAAAMEADMRRVLGKLDGRDFWRGDRLLRRRAYGFVAYSCAYMHGAAGDQVVAIGKLLDSLAWYPLPLRRDEAGVAFGRVKRLGVQFLRLLGVMSPDPGC